jgi:hypothetical protein
MTILLHFYWRSMETKVCATCNEELPVSRYSVQNKTRKSGLKYQCSCNICRSTLRREQFRKVKAEAVAYKGGKCNDCLQIVHQAAFEFHHEDPSTKAAKSETATARKEPTHFLQGTPKLTDQAKTELDKCVLLCANCHRVRHFSDLL